MLQAMLNAIVRYHRGLRLFPLAWKPWLISLLVANMIAPFFWINRVEAQIVFGVALLNYATFVFLTGISGFSRLLGLAHIYWIPLIFFLSTRLELNPADSAFGIWLRIVIALNTVSVILDTANVIRYCRGDRGEMIQDLGQPQR